MAGNAAAQQDEDGPELIDPNAPEAIDPNANLEDDGSTLDTPEEIAEREAQRVAALKDVVAEPEADPTATPGAPKPGTGVMIPKQRFDEVSQRAKDLEAQNELLTQALRANREPAAATPPPAPPAPKFDLMAVQREQLAALAAGEDDKALELAQKINAHLMETATANALAQFEERQQVQTEAQMKRDLDLAVKDVLTLYPQLDPKTEGGGNPDARIFCVGKRDQLIAAGETWANALRQASEATATLFGFDKPNDPNPKPVPPKSLSPELRLVAARQRNLAAAAAQPGNDGGVGNRASQPARMDIKNMTDEQLLALPQSELAKLDGSS